MEISKVISFDELPSCCFTIPNLGEERVVLGQVAKFIEANMLVMQVNRPGPYLGKFQLVRKETTTIPNQVQFTLGNILSSINRSVNQSNI